MFSFDPPRKLSQLCRRHGLPDAAGARFLPLMERVALTRPDLILRVVDFVDRQLRSIARERAEARRLAAIQDEACLKALAPLLHEWRPDRAG